MEPLAYRKMDFEEFCAAATSTYQLEALDRWEDIACTAFEHFEIEGNRVISIEELARVSILIISFSYQYDNVCLHFQV
jgi:Ca2+-binding EF-hand superfamily protein